MSVATGTRTIHRYKLAPNAEGIATVDVAGLDPILRSVDTDLSADISAWFEVTTTDDSQTTPFRFAMLPTGVPTPADAAYLNRTIVGTPFGPLIMHCFRLPTDEPGARGGEPF